MKSLKERAKEQYKGWKKPTPEAQKAFKKLRILQNQKAFDAIMDKAKIDQGLDNLTIYESPKTV